MHNRARPDRGGKTKGTKATPSAKHDHQEPEAAEAENAARRKTPKSTVVAFKVEEDLASFLNDLPNKSDFIRRAIYSQLGISCPLCRGTGSVSKSTHDHFEAFLAKWELHQCEGCGDEFALPKTAQEAAGRLKEQLESVLRGGPDYCYTCFSKPPTRKK